MENAKQPIYPIYGKSEFGLTKLEYFSAMAMQGLLANSVFGSDYYVTAMQSIKAAKALLTELEKEQ